MLGIKPKSKQKLKSKSKPKKVASTSKGRLNSASPLPKKLKETKHHGIDMNNIFSPKTIDYNESKQFYKNK